MKVIAGTDWVAADDVVDELAGGEVREVVWVDAAGDVAKVASAATPGLFGSVFVDVRLSDAKLLPEVLAAFASNARGVVRVDKAPKGVDVEVVSASEPATPAARRANLARYAARLGVGVDEAAWDELGRVDVWVGRNAVRAASVAGKTLTLEFLRLCPRPEVDVTWAQASKVWDGGVLALDSPHAVDAAMLSSWLASRAWASVVACTSVDPSAVKLTPSHASASTRDVSARDLYELVCAAALCRKDRLGVYAAAAAVPLRR